MSDYTFIASGGWTGPATEPDFNEKFATYTDLGVNGSVALFRQYLEAGQTYQIMLETSRTGYSLFRIYNMALLYWKPSDWPGSLVYPFSPTYIDTDGVDVVPAQPESLPYNYALNYNGAGGRRVTVAADETGYWYFCFYKPKLTVDFTGNPLSGGAPLSVYFSRVYVPESPSWDSLTWDMGDGNFVYDDSSFYYEYTNPGTYTVSLTEEAEGDTATEIKPNYITVT